MVTVASFGTIVSYFPQVYQIESDLLGSSVKEGQAFSMLENRRKSW